MTGGTIKDFQITASSEHPDYPATHGRQFGGGWCALPEDHKPYLQVKQPDRNTFLHMHSNFCHLFMRIHIIT